MKLRAVEISNYKSFESARLENFDVVNAITGPNNEGKSSVLEAVSTLGFRHNVVPGGSLNSHLSTRSIQRGNSGGFTISIEVSLNDRDLEYARIDKPSYEAADISGIKFDFSWGRNAPTNLNDEELLVPVSTKVMTNDGRQIPWSNIQGGDPATYSIKRVGLKQVLNGSKRYSSVQSGGALWSSVGNADWGIFQAFDIWAQGIVWIPVHRQVNTDGSLGSSGSLSQSTIAATLLNMDQNTPELYAEFEAVLHTLVPTVSNVYVTISGEGLTIRVTDVPTEDPRSAPRLDHAGGGVAELVYLVSGIWQAREGTTILAEEQERGLHPGAQRRFLSMVLDHCRKYDKQIFWTTHSSVLTPIVPGTSSTIVSFDDSNHSQTKSVTMSDAELVRSALGISPSDIYQHELILVVDGETEVEFFNKLLPERFGFDKASAFYVKAIQGDIESKKEHLAIALSLSASSSTTIFLLADHDGDVEKAIRWISKNIDTPADFKLSTRIHVWDCNLKTSQRKAEFEDNFDLAELVDAANKLASGSKLKEPNLKRQLKDKSHLKTSKLLSDYYFKTYGFELSKPKLARELFSVANSKIKSDQKRGTADGRYEFEAAFDKI